jgi:hypothetical protein
MWRTGDAFGVTGFPFRNTKRPRPAAERMDTETAGVPADLTGAVVGAGGQCSS